MKNYYVNDLDFYFEEILQIERKHFISCVFLNGYKNTLKNENSENRDLLSIITSYRDLTAINANENLYIPNYSYALDVDGLEKNIDDVISQLSCLAVAQAYEVFESYLISILAAFFFHEQEKLVELKWATGSTILLKNEVREAIKKNQGTNNRGLINAVRKCSPNFRMHEINNIHAVNISQWFDVVSMVRHTLIHNRQIISDRLLEYLDKNNAMAIFNRHFKRKLVDSNVHVYLEDNNARDIINWLNSFAHYIFRSLSSDKGFSLKIEQYGQI